MSELRVNIEKLEEATRILDGIDPLIGDIIKQTKNIADELELTWDGEASDYFVGKMRGQIFNLMNCAMVLSAFKNYAENTSESMKKLDEASNVIANSFPGVLQFHSSSSGAVHGGGGATLPDASNEKPSSDSGKKSNEDVDKAASAILQNITETAMQIKKWF